MSASRGWWGPQREGGWSLLPTLFITSQLERGPNVPLSLAPNMGRKWEVESGSVQLSLHCLPRKGTPCGPGEGGRREEVMTTFVTPH